jgi:hypothetical protein
MAEKWSVETSQEESRVALTYGEMRVGMSFKEAEKLGNMLIGACTNSSKTAAPSGRGGKGAKGRKTGAKK